MFDLIKRFGSLVIGSITGFDRIVFKGMLLLLIFAGGAVSFCHRNRILTKDHKTAPIRLSIQ